VADNDANHVEHDRSKRDTCAVTSGIRLLQIETVYGERVDGAGAQPWLKIIMRLFKGKSQHWENSNATV
jgi:hypothetical protein